jgi:hypothetical protein
MIPKYLEQDVDFQKFLKCVEEDSKFSQLEGGAKGILPFLLLLSQGITGTAQNLIQQVVPPTAPNLPLLNSTFSFDNYLNKAKETSQQIGGTLGLSGRTLAQTPPQTPPQVSFFTSPSTPSTPVIPSQGGTLGLSKPSVSLTQLTQINKGRFFENINSLNVAVSNKLINEGLFFENKAFLSSKEISEFYKNSFQIIDDLFKNTSLSYKEFQNTNVIVYVTIKIIFENDNDPKKALSNLKNINSDNFLYKDNLFIRLSEIQKKYVEYLLRLMNIEGFNWEEFYSVFSLADEVCGKIYLSPNLKNIYIGPSMGSFINPNMTINLNFKNSLCNTALFDILERQISYVKPIVDFSKKPSLEKLYNIFFDNSKIEWIDFIEKLEEVYTVKILESLSPQENYEVTQKLDTHYNLKQIKMSDIRGFYEVKILPGRTIGELMEKDYVPDDKKLEKFNPLNKNGLQVKNSLSQTEKIIKDSCTALFNVFVIYNRDEIETFIEDGYKISDETVKYIFQSTAKKVNLEGSIYDWFLSDNFMIAPPQNYIEFNNYNENTKVDVFFKEEDNYEAIFSIIYQLSSASPKDFNEQQIFNFSKERIEKGINNEGRLDPRKVNFEPLKKTWFSETYKKLETWISITFKTLKKLKEELLEIVSYALKIALIMFALSLFINTGGLQITGNFIKLLNNSTPSLLKIGNRGFQQIYNTTFSVSSWMRDYLKSSLAYTAETVLIVNTEKKYPERVRAKVCYTWNLKTLENRMKSFFTEMENMNKKDKKIIMKKSLHYFVLDKEEIIKVNVNDYKTKIKKFLGDFLKMNKSICFLLK